MKYCKPRWGIVLEAFRRSEHLFEIRVLWSSEGADLSTPQAGALLQYGDQETQAVVLREDSVWFGSYDEDDDERRLRKECAIREVISGSEWVLVECDIIPRVRSIVYLDRRVDVPCWTVQIDWAFESLAEHPCLSLEYPNINDKFSSMLELSRERVFELAREMKPTAGDCIRFYHDDGESTSVLMLEAEYSGIAWGNEISKGVKLLASDGELIGIVARSERRQEDAAMS